MRVSPLAVASLLLAAPVLAQTSRSPATPTVAASSFATAEVHLGGRYIGAHWVPNTALMEGPSRIRITYGQPHARGRTVMGGVVPFGTVWRLGANLATILHTDVPLTLGGTFLAPGEYSLYALPGKDSWQLIINKQVAQWGTEYDASQDVARIPLQVATRSDPVESLSIYLVPTLDAKGTTVAPHGTLRIVWEKTELTTEWKVGR